MSTVNEPEGEMLKNENDGFDGSQTRRREVWSEM